MTETLRISVPGGELHAETTGSGPAVVLLHSGTMNLSMWDELVQPLLEAGHQVVRYDERSHGRSSTAITDYHPDDDLEAVLTALDLPAAALIGCSMGGATAMDFALTRPERVTAVALIGGGISPPTFEDPFVLAQHAEQAAAIEAKDAERYVAALLRLGVDGPHRSPEQVDPALRERCRQLAMATVAAHHQATGVQLWRDAMSNLEKITAPVLIVIGELELADLHRIADEAQRRLPDVRRLTLPGVGHLAHLEAPDAVAAAVVSHLAR
jgi:pimeloyl-ACP methyl ester carboxylesterase